MSSALSPEETDALGRLTVLARKRSYYKLLGISKKADQDEIQEAFYALSRKWHPDRFFRRDIGEHGLEIEEVFVAITESYRTLSDRNLRLAYDRKMRESNPTEEEEPQGVQHQATLSHRTKTSKKRSDRAALKERADARRKKRTMARARQLPASMSRVRDQMVEQLQKARNHYRAGKAAYDEGNMVKASSSLQLACSYDPQNETYRKLFEEVKVLARKAMIRGYISAAENAESFQNPREALANYRKAIDLGTQEPAPHYRLAVMMQVYEDDPRGALHHLRTAVKLDGKNIAYRIALARLYLDLNQPLSAKRELQYVLHVDKTHAEAKTLMKKTR